LHVSQQQSHITDRDRPFDDRTASHPNDLDRREARTNAINQKVLSKGPGIFSF
jgi:hypothetical protein